MENIEEIKKMLPKTSLPIDDEETTETLVKMQYLIALWLDSFERQIFEGKTLQELLENTIL